jgi:protein phosphatase
MISTQSIIACANPECANPINPLGSKVCASCDTPIIYRYIWATGLEATKIRPGEKVANRYEVISQQIWLDTKPALTPEIPAQLSASILNYLRLNPFRLHIPQAYGIVKLQGDEILLLENAPIDYSGNLYPKITETWQEATEVRKLYWLWQILELWQPLSELGLAGSLLIEDNIRIQGWCIRLLELKESTQNSLRDLAEVWSHWIGNTSPKLKLYQSLQKILEEMRSDSPDFLSVKRQVNNLLLIAAGELPLYLKVAGATDAGPGRNINEDNCYPNSENHGEENNNINDLLLPRVSIVCDGIGGHEGAEVASFLAMQSLQLQIRAFLTEILSQTEIISPDLLKQQLEASLRVVNNVIFASNQELKRSGLQRMATTMVMAIQIPQKIQQNGNWVSENAHELYLANIGDSRAYWITPNYCQQLTIDDDVSNREVRLGRAIYRQAMERPDAVALTQALGTKEAESLHFNIQRFILEEDGILLLCSDGLSDNDWVDHSWREYSTKILSGEISLEEAVSSWIDLANQKNGHDNTSVVITHSRVSSDFPTPVITLETQTNLQLENQLENPIDNQTEKISESNTQIQDSEIQDTKASEELLDLKIQQEEAELTTEAQALEQKSRRRKSLVSLLGLLFLLMGGTVAGLFTWRQLSPESFEQTCRKLPDTVQKICP